MNRSIPARLMAASALTLLAAVAFWQFGTGTGVSDTDLTVQELVAAPQASLNTHLYSADLDTTTGKPLDPRERSSDVMVGGRRVASYLVSKDKTSQVIVYQDDGVGMSYSKDFYAKLEGDPGPRQKAIFFYTEDGKTVLSEEDDRLDGSAEKIGHRFSDGGYQVFTLFGDGQTAETELLWGPPDPYENDYAPKLFKETRWRSADEGHALAYTDVLNDDGSRDQTNYDEHERPYLIKHLGDRGIAGTTVKGFFPGTDKVRLDSKSDISGTEASYYRLDGTLALELKLTSYSAEPKYFDARGTKALFQQTWWIQVVLDKGGEHDSFVLGDITELNADGTNKRDLSFQDGALVYETLFHATVDGVTYDQVRRFYRKDGTLEKEEFHLAGTSNFKTVEHSVADNIRAVIPPGEFVPVDMSDHLPVPPPERRDRG